MAVAIAPHDASHDPIGEAGIDLGLPPVWLAAAKVAALLAVLTAVVLIIPAAAVYGLSTLLG